eukprot:ctg_759.g359
MRVAERTLRECREGSPSETALTAGSHLVFRGTIRLLPSLHSHCLSTPAYVWKHPRETCVRPARGVGRHAGAGGPAVAARTLQGTRAHRFLAQGRCTQRCTAQTFPPRAGQVARVRQRLPPRTGAQPRQPRTTAAAVPRLASHPAVQRARHRTQQRRPAGHRARGTPA